jgi:hypothetical protein
LELLREGGAVATDNTWVRIIKVDESFAWFSVVGCTRDRNWRDIFSEMNEEE